MKRRKDPNAQCTYTHTHTHKHAHAYTPHRFFAATRWKLFEEIF